MQTFLKVLVAINIFCCCCCCCCLVLCSPVLPQETLTIEGAKDFYKMDEQVEFICMTGKGWPMLQLEWYINDQLARPEQLVRYKPVVADDGLLRSRLGLRFRATRSYFRFESLRIRCAAALNLVYQLKAFEYLIDGFKKAKSASKRYTDGRCRFRPAMAGTTMLC